MSMRSVVPRGIFVFSLALLFGSGMAHALEVKVPELALEQVSVNKKYWFGYPIELGQGLKSGSKVTLVSLESGKKVGSATLTNVKKVKFKELERPAHRRKYYYMWFFYDVPSSAKAMLTFNLKNVQLNRKFSPRVSRIIREKLPLVTTIDRITAGRMMSQGALALDVSHYMPNESGTARFTIPGAKFIGYTPVVIPNGIGGYSFKTHEIPTVMNSDSFNNKELFRQIVTKYRGNKAAKFIVFCQHERSPNCPRAILHMRQQGLKNIYWYRKGAMDWHGKLRMIPTKVDGIKVIDFTAAKQMSQKGALMLDIRRSRDFNIVRMKKSRNIYYPVRKWPGFPFSERTYPRKAAQVELAKGRFNTNAINGYKNKEVVVFAFDESRWIAYLAAITLRDRGFKKVSLYRGGVYDWISNGGQIISKTQGKK